MTSLSTIPSINNLLAAAALAVAAYSVGYSDHEYRAALAFLDEVRRLHDCSAWMLDHGDDVAVRENALRAEVYSLAAEHVVTIEGWAALPMSRSLATTAGERGLAPSKPRSQPDSHDALSLKRLFANLKRDFAALKRSLAAHPCPACMKDAREWLNCLSLEAFEGAALALSPVLSLRGRRFSLRRGRAHFRLYFDLLNTVSALPAAILDGIAFSAAMGRDYINALLLDSFALGATLDRAAAELRALARAERTALTPPAPAKRRALSETT